MLIDSDLTSDNQPHCDGSYHFAHGSLNRVMGQFEGTLYSLYHLPGQGKLYEKRRLIKRLEVNVSLFAVALDNHIDK